LVIIFSRFFYMKFFNNVKTIVIIFLSFILLINILQYLSLYKEGLTYSTELTDYKPETIEDSTPSCSNASTNQGSYLDSSDVPPCYADLVNTKNGADGIYSSDYMLKTQIQSPVCPGGYIYGSSSIGTDISETNQKINTPNDVSNNTYRYDICYNIYNTGFTREMQEYMDRLYNLNLVNTPSSNTSTTTNSTPASSETKYTINDELAMNSPQNSYPEITPYQGPQVSSIPEPNSSFIDNSVNVVNGDGKCPPCPACQRCPEPIVECTKTVNYSAARDASLLPVPIIDDFSKFT
jgi:hypothetical protein